jgi:hypothetical protein
MLQPLHLDVSKVDQSVAHVMRVGSDGWCGRRPGRCGQRGPAAGALARKPDTLGRTLAVRELSEL